MSRRDHSIFDAELSGRSFDFRLTLRLLRRLHPYRRRVAGSIACILGMSLGAVLLPVITARVVIDGVLLRASGPAAPDFGMQELTAALAASSGLPLLVVACGLYGGIAAAMLGLAHASRMLLSRAALSGLRDLRRDLFVHLQQLSPGFYDKVAVGRVMTRVTNDVEILYQLLVGFGMLVGEMLPFFLALGLMLAADATLATRSPGSTRTSRRTCPGSASSSSTVARPATSRATARSTARTAPRRAGRSTSRSATAPSSTACPRWPWR